MQINNQNIPTEVHRLVDGAGKMGRMHVPGSICMAKALTYSQFEIANICWSIAIESSPNYSKNVSANGIEFWSSGRCARAMDWFVAPSDFAWTSVQHAFSEQILEISLRG